MVARGKRTARRPWILVRYEPRPEGAQYSVARFAGSLIQRNVIPGLRSLRSLTRGYLLPPLGGSLTRTSAFTFLFTSRYQIRRIQQSLAADGAIACFSRIWFPQLESDRAPQLKQSVRRGIMYKFDWL